ncbi:MAG: pantothenate kinase [Firmicutes bacterium]|nr:pantothenate kinase [Bacillota bacterium]
MGIIIGIDVGGSTTKICGFTDDGKKLIKPLFVKATDPLASVYGAFGKFTQINDIPLENVSEVRVTGVGSSFITTDLFERKTKHVEEFNAIGLGGLHLSGLRRAIVVSMGTGTATVMADADKDSLVYLGGTGVGGGTLLGLSKKMLNMQDISLISELAETGSLDNVDLRISDITQKNIIPTLPVETTASNFGKLSDIASKGDIALGIINMIFETIGMIAVFASRSYGISDIVLTGNLAAIKQAKPTFEGLGHMFSTNFLIPDIAEFGTVIGAALTYFREEK